MAKKYMITLIMDDQMVAQNDEDETVYVRR